MFVVLTFWFAFVMRRLPPQPGNEKKEIFGCVWHLLIMFLFCKCYLGGHFSHVVFV